MADSPRWSFPVLLLLSLQWGLSGCGGGSPAVADDAGTSAQDAAADAAARDTGSPVADDAAPVPVDAAADATLDALPPLPDAEWPDLGPLPSQDKVAAIQYGSTQAAQVKPSCASTALPDVCAVQEMVIQARLAGAYFVVAPEYGLGQEYLEPYPSVGENPGTDPSWPADMIIKIFSQTARQLGIYLIINLQTYTGTDPDYTLYNTNVAYDPEGTIVGLHRKFNLYANEIGNLTPGDDVMVFSTPLGTMGMLICADLFGNPALIAKLTTTLAARVVAFSSFWEAPFANAAFKNFADVTNIYLIASNTTFLPGYGGGVWDPDGTTLAENVSQTPNIIYATVPLP